MFARFHQTPLRLQVSLRESRRIGGKPRCEHIASLGSIAEPMTTAGRVAFWARLHQRLAKLANRIGADEQGKILGAVHARIPMVTIDELRALQRENAEADARLWTGLQDMSAEMATGQRGLAALVSQRAADSEAMAQDAAEKAAAAKDRLSRLAKGEDVVEGLGKRENFEKVLMDAGWTRDDIRHSIELARLCDGREDLFDAFVNEGCKLRDRREKSDRWKVLRKVRAMRGR
jgi:hypothetical protein